MQGALELLGIPYTGSGVMASAIAMDKVMTKRVWLAEGLPTPRYVLLRRGDLAAASSVRAVPDELGLPLIVKPPREGSSIGVTKVQGYSRDAGRGGRWPPRYDADVLCEEFIDGDEVTCPVLGDGRRRARAAGDPHRRARGQLRLPEQVLHRRHRSTSCPSGLPDGEEAEIQRIVAGGLPRAGLPRLGPRRPDDARAATASPSCWR